MVQPIGRNETLNMIHGTDAGNHKTSQLQSNHHGQSVDPNWLFVMAAHKFTDMEFSSLPKGSLSLSNRAKSPQCANAIND